MITLQVGNKVYEYVFKSPDSTVKELEYRIQKLNIDHLQDKQTNKDSSIVSNLNASDSEIISNIKQK